MFIVHVSLHVKPESLDDFVEATKDNASNSILEPGVIRFDFLQSTEIPTDFALVEVYHRPEDFELHKQTPHYFRWRDRVADMMAVPRVGVKYRNILPVDADWKK